jgi:hemerythrin-like domain-containing protein
MQKNLKGYMKQDRKISSLEQEIEANLKRVYDDVAKQEVPDRFTQLLEQLRKADKSSSETSND